MKINKNEANLLATEVRNMIIATNKDLDPKAVAKVKAFCKKRTALNTAMDNLRALHAENIKVFCNQFPKMQNYSGSTEKSIIEALANVHVPRVDQIVSKIILKSLFASPDDMKAFIEEIVKEYTKKK